MRTFTFNRVFGLKLWYPQILQTINDYEKNYGNDDITVCKVFEDLTNKNDSAADNCTVVSLKTHSFMKGFRLNNVISKKKNTSLSEYYLTRFLLKYVLQHTIVLFPLLEMS